MRCFLAVPVRSPALEDAQRLLAALAGRLPDVRWVRPESLHITLHFFGSIDEPNAHAALEALRPRVEATSRFPVALDCLGAFPSRGQPRVLWLGCTETVPPLQDLASTTRETLRAQGLATEERAFTAHCTLGRPRGSWTPALCARWIELAREGVHIRRFTADGVVLYESRTTPAGALHTPVSEVRFA